MKRSSILSRGRSLSRSIGSGFALVLPLLMLVGFGHTPALLAQESSPSPIDFNRDIAPIFAQHCFDCHGPDEQEAALRLDRAKALEGGDSGEPLVVAGDPASSHLIQLVTSESDRMPPDGDPLSEDEIARLTAWIEQGASWPVAAGEEEETDFPPSFLPLVDSPLPLPETVIGIRDEAGPIDRWLSVAQQRRGVVPVGPAAAREWLIRASLVTTGLRPSLEEMERFALDQRPDARDREIDRLLASPAVGERWARHWLDVVRFAETSGFETNVPRNDAFPYRDWVIRSLNSDLPMDEFIRNQIAGDSFGQDEATGFIVGGAWDQVKSSDPVLTAMQRQDELADMINTTGTTFMGITIGCARCHNHKFDPITQRDYYAMQAVFAGVQHGSRPFQPELSDSDRARMTELGERIAQLESDLKSWESPGSRAVSFGTRMIDDSSTSVIAERLVPEVGTTPLISDPLRGGANDLGAANRLPEVAGGYTWWNNVPGQAFARYPVGSQDLGDLTARLWISWGCGWQTHSANAEYWLDQDGKWSTSDDREQIAVVDQRHYADGSPAPDSQIRTSGFFDAGLFSVSSTAALFLVGGSEGSAITCDAIVISPISPETSWVQPSLPALRPRISSLQNELRFEKVLADRVRFEILASNSGEPCLDELEVFSIDGENVALASRGAEVQSGGDLQGYEIHQLKHLNDGVYGNDRSWISNSANTGWVEIRWKEPVWIEAIVWGRDRQGRFADRTATEYLVSVAQGDQPWIAVADHRAHAPQSSQPGPWLVDRFAGADEGTSELIAQALAELEECRKELQRFAGTNQSVYAGQFTTPPAVHRLYRGDPMAEREVVAPAVPEALGTLVSAESFDSLGEAARRREFAEWLSSSEQALPWRVMANRVWQQVFGRGIVSTPSDFGRNGAQAVHPELLDRLAIDLRRDQSFKHLLREMLVSSAFARSGTADPQNASIDAEATLLWRFAPRRLEAEAIRDCLLDATGALRRTMYGPGYSVFEPNDNYVRNYIPLDRFGPETWRRMVYMTKVRMEQDPVFGQFDVPDAGQVCPRRTVSTTPLQALNLFNSTFVLDQADRLYEELQREAPDNLEVQINLAFVRILGREPIEREAIAARQLVQEHGTVALLRALWNSNEFLTIP